ISTAMVLPPHAAKVRVNTTPMRPAGPNSSAEITQLDAHALVPVVPLLGPRAVLELHELSHAVDGEVVHEAEAEVRAGPEPARLPEEVVRGIGRERRVLVHGGVDVLETDPRLKQRAQRSCEPQAVAALVDVGVDAEIAHELHGHAAREAQAEDRVHDLVI